MKMYFHFDIGMDYVLFQFWKPATTFEMTYTCIALLLMGVFLEGVIYIRALVNSKQVLAVARCNAANGNQTKYSSHLLNRWHLLQTGLHGLQYVFSYYLMLVAMTYQVHFIIFIIWGLCVGYWIFTPLSNKLKLTSQTGDLFADVGH